MILALKVLLISALIGAVGGLGLRLVSDFLQRRGRTLGLVLIALGTTVAGLLLLAAAGCGLYAMYVRYPVLQANLQRIGTTPEELFIRLLIAGVLALLAGIGLWRCTPWGWEMATWAIGCGVGSDVMCLLLGSGAAAGLGLSLQTFYIRHAVLAGIGVALLLYLYRPPIRRCCGREVHAPRHVWRLFQSVALGLGVEVGLHLLLL